MPRKSSLICGEEILHEENPQGRFFMKKKKIFRRSLVRR
jgi:hypothetical protein